MRPSLLAQNVKPSATLSLNAKAKAMGDAVVKFTVGEPDFETPENIRQAGILAIQSGRTRYTPASGTPELRQAIADKFLRDNGLTYDPKNIIVSNGAKQALYIILMCLVDDGDEVLLPAPYWVSYADQAEICGATPVVIDAVDTPDFKLTPDLLSGALNDRSKVLVLNSPNNPSGAVYTEDELRALVDLALENDLWIISDEVYESLIYDGGTHASPASFSPEAYAHTITFNAVSKTYAMTGWRIGYAAGPAEIIEAAGRIQSNLTSGPNSIAQYAATEALNGPQDSVGDMRAAFDERRELIVAGLNDLDGVRCRKPDGAFYALADCTGLLGHTYGGREVATTLDLSAALLETVKIAVVPGEPFGSPGYLRFSYATSTKNIEEGLRRFGDFIATRG